MHIAKKKPSDELLYVKTLQRPYRESYVKIISPQAAVLLQQIGIP